jgi:hypothetical protein
MFLWELLVIKPEGSLVYYQLYAEDEIQANEELIRTSSLFHKKPLKMVRIIKLNDELVL